MSANDLAGRFSAPKQLQALVTGGLGMLPG